MTPLHHIKAPGAARTALDWERIDTVLLDMDGTLLDLHFDNWFWQSFLPGHQAQAEGVEESEARERLFNRFRACAGTLDWYCTDYWSRELALDITALKRSVSARIGFLPGAEDFLRRLSATGKRRVLVTNAHPAVLALKAERTSLLQYFDAAHSSHSYGAPKESADFWNRLHLVEPFDPARTLFVDDHLPVLRAAAGFGIAHLLAICRPDSMQPLRNVTEFAAVESVASISMETR